MHVSNLLTASRALISFSEGKGTISPFCTWLGDARLLISKSLDAAHVTGEDGKLLPDISQQEAVTAVLLLVALRGNPSLQVPASTTEQPT